MFGPSSIPRSSRAQLRLANLTLKRLLRFNLRLIVSRAVSLTLLLCLLTTSTPAAPQTVVAVAKETSVSFYFWYQGSLLAKLIQGRVTNVRAQEKQEERDALITRLQIYPGDVTIKLDDRVIFVAVAYDREGASIGGWGSGGVSAVGRNGEGPESHHRASLKPGMRARSRFQPRREDTVHR